MNEEAIIMTKEQAIEQLKKQQQNDDTESAHSNADDILCSFLEHLGYKDIVEEFDKIKKWYA